MRFLERLPNDRRGNVVIIFSLAVVPLFVLAAAAVEFGRVSAAHSTLQSVADAAALDAAIFVSQQIAQGSNPSNGQVKSQFKNMVAARSVTTAKYSVFTSNATLTRTPTQITVAATAAATVKPMFGKFLHSNSYPVSVSATVTKRLADFANISLVLDVSPSMAIAATAADIAVLQSATGGCAFACHDMESTTLPPPTGKTNYDIARANNVTLRIDVVKQAAQQLANYVPSAQQVANQYSMGLFTMGSFLTTKVASTTDFAQVSAAIPAIDFDRMSVVVPALNLPVALQTNMVLTNFSDSDFKTTLTSLNAQVPPAGDGSSVNARSQFIFLVTDGLSDTANPINGAVNTTYNYPPVPNFLVSGNDWGKTTQPLDPSWCSQFKNRNVSVAVLYVTYVPNPTDPTGDYQKAVQYNAPQDKLVQNLTACASSGLFRQASDSSQIGAMLQDLFNAVAMTPRVTN